MTSWVAVAGCGPRAAGWTTRFLAAGLDVVVDDPEVRALVAERWPEAQRLGLFPGASPDRLTIDVEHARFDDARLVQVVGDAPTPLGAALVATDISAYAHEPIHLLPLVQVAVHEHTDALCDFYASIGMAPRRTDAHPLECWRLGPALVDLTDGDPDAIIAVMRALRSSAQPAGTAMADHEARRLATAAIAPWRPGDEVAAPLDLYRTPVESEWVDYNGHMTEAAYLTAAGWASDALFRHIGDDEAYRAAGHSFYTVETHIHFLLEVAVHEPLRIRTQVLGVDTKRVHLVHSMHHGDTGALLSTVEQMLVHVDMQAGRSAPILPAVAEALAAIAEAHAPLPIPPQVGSVMRLPTPTR